MEVGKNKLRSIIKQVQNSAEVIANKNQKKLENCNTLSIINPDVNTQLDLTAAIEYNYCLINSYLQERSQRKLSPYEEILKGFNNEEHDENTIINSIGKEFFLDPKSFEDKFQSDFNDSHSDGQSQIIEICVLNKLPGISEMAPNLGDEFLNYIENEKKKLEKQQIIVSKRLTEMILTNNKHFKKELDRIRSIETNLTQTVKICSDGRHALSLSKRDFTETSINIIKNYHRREEIRTIIECLQNIKKLRQNIEHIEYMLQYEKNFCTAIDLFDEKFEQLETMSSQYRCVAEMKEKLVQTLQLVDDQMDSVLAKMTERFCLETFAQLCKAYSQIGKLESSVHHLLLHFTNSIHDKAFSIVLGYVKLFTPDHVDLLSTLGHANGSSTPIKANSKKANEPSNPNESNLKRKPFEELCQYLNPESFLQCLTDLCRAQWDIMNNYYKILCFYKNNLRLQATLPEEEIDFAVNKFSQGVLRVWSDIQHKIRTLVSSVQFVQPNQDIEDLPQTNDSIDQKTFQDHQQDHLLFSFEEFIKILTVCERMIEVGEQFCRLYDRKSDETSVDTTIEFQNTLYQQTRAYFQSYHQVSMNELKIFLENEIWTRCPIDSDDEFELIANLQEFSFMKNRFLKMKKSYKQTTSSNDWNKSFKKSISRGNSSSCILSPVKEIKDSQDFSVSYFRPLNNDEIDENFSSNPSPFDGIMSRIVSQHTFDDSDSEELPNDDYNEGKSSDKEGSEYLEIVTTNTTLNVLRLMGRYMNIMFLLRPISHDIIRALLELFDYYFYTVYNFFAIDVLSVSWLLNSTNSLSMTEMILPVTNNNQMAATSVNSISNQQQQTRLFDHFSSFIRRINSNSNDSRVQQNDSTPSSSPSKNMQSSPIKHPCPVLSEYVSIGSQSNHYALGERIMAIQSLIFIARQFYHVCPFLLEFLRFDEGFPVEQIEEADSNTFSYRHKNMRKKSVEDGFKLLQFYYDKMCSSVESLQYQCLYAVASKILPYETIVQQMNQTKWDLKEIPSIHSSYVNVFVRHLLDFDITYRRLLESYDLVFSIPKTTNENDPKIKPISEDQDMPLVKLSMLSWRMNLTLWECILKISNRMFVEGFSSAKRCSNEGRALMQLDYEQFLSHIEKILLPYFKAASCHSFSTLKSNDSFRTLKSYLATERLYVEEFVKAFYITESTFIEWIKQRPDYTTKQIVSLINCITVDNKKLRSTLLAAIDASSIDNQPSLINNNSLNQSSSSNTISH